MIDRLRSVPVGGWYVLSDRLLGKLYWGKRKVRAIRQALAVQLPFIDVRAIPQTIEAALDQNLIALHDFDLIVSALGNPTAELALN